MQNVLEALNWRYAVKKYDPSKKIPPEDWGVITEALRLTASSYGLQPWRFFVVQNPEVRAKLLPFSEWNRGLVEECSHLLVIATKTGIDEAYLDFYLTELAKTRGIDFEGQKIPPVLQGYKDMMAANLLSLPQANIAQWAAKQGYIALGNALAAAAMLKVDSTPVEGFNPQGYNQVLNIEEGYTATLICPFGYRSSEDKNSKVKKFRFSRDFLFTEI